jgi:hypothetical protein
VVLKLLVPKFTELIMFKISLREIWNNSTEYPDISVTLSQSVNTLSQSKLEKFVINFKIVPESEMRNVTKLEK